MDFLVAIALVALVTWIYAKLTRNRPASSIAYRKDVFKNELYHEDDRIRGFSVDYVDKQFKLEVDPHTTFRFEDVVKYELTENGRQITSGGLSIGRAVVGNVLLGGTGMLLGGLTGNRKSRDVVNNMSIKITMSGENRGLYTLPLIRKKTKKTSKDYTRAVEDAEKIISIFDIAMDEIEKSK